LEIIKKKITIESKEELKIKMNKKMIREEERLKKQKEDAQVWRSDTHKRAMLDSLPIYLAHRNIRGPRDIHVQGFRLLTPNNEELLSDADLRLIDGRRYGLIGRNGVGKSTLLRMISAYQIKGFPLYIKVMHVEQEVEGNAQNVIDYVISSDLERQYLVTEEKNC